MTKKLVTERTVYEAARQAQGISVGDDTLITPAARDLARQLGVAVSVTGHSLSKRPPERSEGGEGTGVRLALGSDHGGFKLKEALRSTVTDVGFEITDVGCTSTDPVDYPVFAARVAELVAGGEATFGIMVDGAGIGSAMVANKIKGVRAALCYDLTTAKNAREHNNANVLTLGGGLIGERLAQDIVRTFLTTPFGGDRHARRVAMIDALDS